MFVNILSRGSSEWIRCTFAKIDNACSSMSVYIKKVHSVGVFFPAKKKGAESGLENCFWQVKQRCDLCTVLFSDSKFSFTAENTWSLKKNCLVWKFMSVWLALRLNMVLLWPKQSSIEARCCGAPQNVNTVSYCCFEIYRSTEVKDALTLSLISTLILKCNGVGCVMNESAEKSLNCF